MNTTQPVRRSLSKQYDNAINTDSRHQGCLERLRIMAAELDRMSEALRAKTQECNELRSLSGDTQELFVQLEQERLKYANFKAVKDKQVAELEDENDRVHKQLKEEKLEKMDYINKYQQKCEEVAILTKESQNQLPKQSFANRQDFKQETTRVQQLQSNMNANTTSPPVSKSIVTRSYQMETRVNDNPPEVKSKFMRTVDGKVEQSYETDKPINRESQYKNGTGFRDSQQLKSTIQRQSMQLQEPINVRQSIQQKSFKQY